MQPRHEIFELAGLRMPAVDFLHSAVLVDDLEQLVDDGVGRIEQKGVDFL